MVFVVIAVVVVVVFVVAIIVGHKTLKFGKKWVNDVDVAAAAADDVVVVLSQIPCIKSLVKIGPVIDKMLPLLFLLMLLLFFITNLT